jgi:hypothetical protein
MIWKLRETDEQDEGAKGKGWTPNVYSWRISKT